MFNFIFFTNLATKDLTEIYSSCSHFTCFATQHNRTYTSSTLPLIAMIIGIQSESKVKDCSIMILLISMSTIAKSFSSNTRTQSYLLPYQI